MASSGRSRADWQRHLEQDVAFATERLLTVGEVKPLFVVYPSGDGPVILVPAGWADDGEKWLVRQTIRLLAVAHDAEAVSFMGEFWLRHLEKRPGESHAAFRQRQDAVRPEDAEDRIEIMMVIFAYRGETGARDHLVRAMEIVRDAAGKPSGVRARGGADVGQFSGPMFDVLPAEAPDAGLRAAALALVEMMKIEVETRH